MTTFWGNAASLPLGRRNPTSAYEHTKCVVNSSLFPEKKEIKDKLSFRVTKFKKKKIANPEEEEKKQESFLYSRSTPGKAKDLCLLTFLSVVCTYPHQPNTSLIRSRSPNSRRDNKKGWHNILVLIHKDVYVHSD